MDKKPSDPLAPAGWLAFFAKANLRTKELTETPSARGKSVLIGRFLSPNVGRVVPIEVKGRGGRAVLRVREGRANSKGYFFEVSWDEPGEESLGPTKVPTDKGPAAPTAKVKPAVPAAKKLSTKKQVPPNSRKTVASTPSPTTAKKTTIEESSTTKQKTTQTPPASPPKKAPPKGPMIGNSEAW